MYNNYINNIYVYIIFAGFIFLITVRCCNFPFVTDGDVVLVWSSFLWLMITLWTNPTVYLGSFSTLCRCASVSLPSTASDFLHCLVFFYEAWKRLWGTVIRLLICQLDMIKLYLACDLANETTCFYSKNIQKMCFFVFPWEFQI